MKTPLTTDQIAKIRSDDLINLFIKMIETRESMTESNFNLNNAIADTKAELTARGLVNKMTARFAARVKQTGRIQKGKRRNG